MSPLLLAKFLGHERKDWNPRIAELSWAVLIHKTRTSSGRKTRKKTLPQLSVKLPPKRVRAEFLIVYELEGCQKAVDFLTEYYGVNRMKIILDGRRVSKRCYGGYLKNKAYFTREGLKKRVVLHELYHHLVDSKGFELETRTEEKEANSYVQFFKI
jgi:hypothetical protein